MVWLSKISGYPLRLIIILSAVLVLLTAGWATACNEQEESDGDTSGFLFPITLFQRFVSPGDGARCPLYPSCSAYSKEAFSKHGPLLGWIMTSDRLMRCGRDEVKQGGAVRVGRSVLTADSVASNDFWWK